MWVFPVDASHVLKPRSPVSYILSSYLSLAGRPEHWIVHRLSFLISLIQRIIPRRFYCHSVTCHSERIDECSIFWYNRFLAIWIFWLFCNSFLSKVWYVIYIWAECILSDLQDPPPNDCLAASLEYLRIMCSWAMSPSPIQLLTRWQEDHNVITPLLWWRDREEILVLRCPSCRKYLWPSAWYDVRAGDTFYVSQEASLIMSLSITNQQM